MISIGQRFLVLIAFLAIFSPALRSEQLQKGSSRVTLEDRLKKLEERADAAEKAASTAVMEKDYLARTQKQYESYYQKVLNTQMWTLGISDLDELAFAALQSPWFTPLVNERSPAPAPKRSPSRRGAP